MMEVEGDREGREWDAALCDTDQERLCGREAKPRLGGNLHLSFEPTGWKPRDILGAAEDCPCGLFVCPYEDWAA